MSRFLVNLGAALLISSGNALLTNAATTNFSLTFNVAAATPNTMTLTDASGQGEANYPLQFGRPFLAGAMPSGQCPNVLVNGNAVASQADIKNRYPDGSTEYAVMAVVVPAIPANGAVTLSFAPGACNNAPLTTAQMLDPSYNFDANVLMVPNTGAATTFSGDNTNAALMLANGDYKLWTSGPVAQTILLGDDTTARKYDVGFGDGFHPVRPRYEATFWPATHQVFVRAIVENDLTTEIEDTSYAATIKGGATSPVTEYQEDLTGTGSAFPGEGNPGLTVAAAFPAAGNGNLSVSGTPSTPLVFANYLARDTATGEWFLFLYLNSTTLDVLQRGEDNSTVGAMSPGDPIVIGAPKHDWTLSRWTKTFWLGGTPQPKVNQDFNLAYLSSTRFLPNFDPTITLNPTTLANYYATWLASPHDIYDGQWDGGMWGSSQGEAGATPWIGPYPQWTSNWLASHGDWRMAQVAYNLADIGGNAPGNLRESAVGKRFARTDPVGSSTGLGLPTTNAGRPTLFTFEDVAGLSYSGQQPADRVIEVGSFNSNPPFNFEGEHQPAAFFPQYIISGDPYYLDQMANWAAFTTGFPNCANNVSCGPNQDDDALDAEGITRAWAWESRNRAEAAFAEPDGTPQKAFFTYAMNDALARQEGAFGIAGTVYDGTPLKVWGATEGNQFTQNAGTGFARQAIPTHEWASDATPVYTQTNWTPLAGQASPIGAQCSCYINGSTGSFGDPWMLEYVQYSLGRIAELGFAAKPLQAYTIGFFNQIISYGQMTLGIYEDAPQAAGGAFFPTWAAQMAQLNPSYLSGVNYDPGNGSEGVGGLPAFWQGNTIGANGRGMWLSPGLAMAVDNGASGAQASWSWFNTNLYQQAVLGTYPATPFSAWPQWDIIPRTDNNALPAMPTTMPPG